VLTLRPSLPRVDPARAERAAILLDRALGGSKVLTARDLCEPFARDESEAIGESPDIVVHAASADDIQTTLRIANEAGVPVTPRAGGSGRTGGAVPVCAGIVLATAAMTSIKEIDKTDLLVVAEPGVILSDLQDAVEREGLFFPPDPSSATYCCLGGNVAANAGGPRAFKYGSVNRYVLGLEVTLMDGTRLQTGRRTMKGVTGYDLTSLMVGSEGTLGVISEVTLRLVPKPPAVGTLLALFDHVRAAGAAVRDIVARGLVPRCLEILDATTLEAVRRSGVPIDTRAGAMLLIEVDGEPATCEVELERVGEACSTSGAIDVLVAQDAAQRDRLWKARKEMSRAVRALTKNKLSEDVVVPRSRLVDLLDQVDRISESSGVKMLSYGHAGDGNLHVNFLWNDPDELPRVDLAIERLFREVVAMRGTLSGEHGIGVLKAPYLPLEQSADLIAVQRKIKATLDPAGLLNPGKIFPVLGHRDC
jgi:glycolate oxidase